MTAARERRSLGESLRTVTVKLTPSQLAALAHAVFTDTSARPSGEKNAAEAAVRKLQTEVRRRAAGE